MLTLGETAMARNKRRARGEEDRQTDRGGAHLRPPKRRHKIRFLPGTWLESCPDHLCSPAHPEKAPQPRSQMASRVVPALQDRHGYTRARAPSQP